MNIVATALSVLLPSGAALALAFVFPTAAHAGAEEGRGAALAPGDARAAHIETPGVEGAAIEGAAIEGAPTASPPPPGTAASDDGPGLKWTYGWKMWHGLDVSASARTGIDTQVPALPILNLQEVKFAGSLGGRIEVDGAGYDLRGDLGGWSSGFALRRARLTAKGSSILGVGYDYRIDFGYASGRFTVTQAYVAVPSVRLLGTVQFGQFAPPVGLQLITSSWDIAFMEPAAPLQAIAPPSQPGVQASDTFLDKHGTWTIGVYAGVGTGGDYGSGSKRFGNLMGRTTWLALDEINADHPADNGYLHVGLSANLQRASNGTIRYRSRPESHLAPFVIDTGTIETSRAATLGAELLWVRGPLTVQGEIITSRIDATASGVLRFGGGYALASWALTGERRPYDRDAGVPGRLVPLRNFDFGPHAGWGALEAAARVSYTDLSDAAVRGGRLTMLMSSLNWILRPELEFRFELGGGRINGAEGVAGNGRFVLAQLRMGVYFF